MGNLQLEASYLNGFFHGDMKCYTKDEKLLALIKADNHKFINGKCYNNKVLTDKDLEEISNANNEEVIKYLQKYVLKREILNSL